MYLIATDEAGYGPKLGPLVIVATAWKLPGQRLTAAEITDRFATLASPTRHGDLTITIDDSKKVYRQGEGLALLHAAACAGLQWCGCADASFPGALEYLCPQDYQTIAESPWLTPEESVPSLAADSCHRMISQWSASGLELVDVKARVITAKRFNQACGEGFNKADLLSHATLGLVKTMALSLPTVAPHGEVFCDRHGGRRYYAGPLQHHFPDWMLQVVAESKSQSKYRLRLEDSEIDVHFTVKGDQFPPVAFSSLIAKYLRERFMESINTFFANRHTGTLPLKPTAGYPVDADRFLQQIATIRERESILDIDFVRQR